MDKWWWYGNKKNKDKKDGRFYQNHQRRQWRAQTEAATTVTYQDFLKIPVREPLQVPADDDEEEVAANAVYPLNLKRASTLYALELDGLSKMDKLIGVSDGQNPGTFACFRGWDFSQSLLGRIFKTSFGKSTKVTSPWCRDSPPCRR